MREAQREGDGEGGKEGGMKRKEEKGGNAYTLHIVIIHVHT